MEDVAVPLGVIVVDIYVAPISVTVNEYLCFSMELADNTSFSVTAFKARPDAKFAMVSREPQLCLVRLGRISHRSSVVLTAASHAASRSPSVIGTADQIGKKWGQSKFVWKVDYFYFFKHF
jgi:hypothetical protein